MKLNRECMRAVLCFLEDDIELESRSDSLVPDMGAKDIVYIYQALPQWKNEDIYYALFNLQQAGFIDATEDFGDYVVNYITFSGHEFLETIRDDGRWKRINRGLSSVRDYSLSAIQAIAQGITSGAISAFLSANAAGSTPPA